MKRPEVIRREFVRQWLRKAAADLAAARHLMSGDVDLLASAAFHAQQAAEKVLKAVLTWHQCEVPKTHDLALLVDHIAARDPELGARVRRSVALTPYGVAARHPGDFPEPASAEVQAAVDLAGEILRAVLDSLPAEVRPPEGPS